MESFNTTIGQMTGMSQQKNSTKQSQNNGCRSRMY